MQLSIARADIPMLRPYQQVCCASVEDSWASGMHRMIVVLPTGGGKTECAIFLARNAKNPLFIAHRRSLVRQAERRTGMVSATIQSLRSNQDKTGSPWPCGVPDLIIFDEVHHYDSQDWQALFECIPETTLILGLTATPWRFTQGASAETKRKNERFGKGLGDMFDGMVIGAKPSELVRDGYLVPLEVIDVVEAEDRRCICSGELGPSYDFDESRHTGFIKADAAQRLCSYSAWRQYAQGRKTVVYSHLVESAQLALDRFQAAGVPSDIVHGKIKPEECERRLAAFARGDLQVLVNCMQLTEGTDVPDIGCVIIDRGCATLNPYIQICGRAARPAPGKTGALILDLTGCSKKHGHPQKDQDYWVVTAEARNQSEQCCTVCGTRVNPMFPTRCMRCDPFIPVVGARREVLDCGGRIYSRLKAACEDTHDAQARDEAAIAAMNTALQLDDITDAERVIAETEIRLAKASMQRREDEQRAELARVEAARLAQERAEALRAQQAAATLSREEWEQKRRERTQKIEDKLSPTLRRHIQYARSKQWSISWACKRTRDEKYPGMYDSKSYDMPPELTAALGNLPEAAELQEYEVGRMLADERTGKFGAAWCRRKVAKLFGR